MEIAINDVEVDLQMKLGAAGEAFFVEEVLSEENVPYNLATSPIPSSSYLLDNKFNFKERNKVIGSFFYSFKNHYIKNNFSIYSSLSQFSTRENDLAEKLLLFGGVEIEQF